MATVYGVTPQGYVGKSQQVITDEIKTALKAVFGNNINFAPQSNFGQLVGIFSEREALLWSLGQAIYTSKNPNAAEGTSVDDILALNNLKRLPATATRTNPVPVTEANGITEYGLVLFGTPGTVVPVGSLIQTTASPPLTFKTDANITIAASANAKQGIFFSNVPTTGVWSLTFESPEGNLLTTPLMQYNALAGISQISFASVPVLGDYKIALSSAGATLTTATIAFGASAAQVQVAIRALAGYAGVIVTGDTTLGFQVNWGGIANPLTTIVNNTTTVAIAPIDSVQASINTLLDTGAANYPFTDVVVTVASQGFTVSFGALTPITPNPSSAAQGIPLIILASNNMQMSTTVTNINIVNDVNGKPAQGTGSATCTVTGPNFVAAAALSVIGSSVSGWTSVTNQLDCLTGANVESDTEALERREAFLQANANGPLQSIIEKVRQVTNVTATIGFENLNDAAIQKIIFSLQPSTGSYQLIVNNMLTAPIQYTATAAQVQTAIAALAGYSMVLVSGDALSNFSIDFNGAFGGQPQEPIVIVNNTTNAAITQGWGRPGHSFEIVAQGGADLDIAQVIYDAKPAGIETYGTETVVIFDSQNNPHNIHFSRPTEVPIYVTINMNTDIGQHDQKFNPASVATIQQDIVDIGNKVSIGGLIIGFGSDGLIGAFNSVEGIVHYSMFFGRTPNPTQNVNIQMQSEEVPVFETFNVTVSYQ